MKLASYRKNGVATFGAVVGDGLVTLGGKVGGAKTLREALAAGALPEIAKLLKGAKSDIAIKDADFLPLIPDPGKIVCIGINYSDHATETGRTNDAAREMPGFFVRYPSSLLGHGHPMERPKVSTHYDFEGELAVIIGKAGRHVPIEKALDCVAGYACFVDGSVRDFQARSTATGKNFFASGPLGPWMTTSDEIPDPQKLELTTRLNGEVMQHASLETMIHSVAKSIAFISTIAPLEPGDVLATGTPAGVGSRRKPPLWMKAGDRLEVEISSIGVLANPVVDER